MSERLYKFLRSGRVGPYSGVTWPAPGGAWLVASEPLEPCVRGIHVARVGDLPFWISDELWEVETDGAPMARRRKVVFPRARLIARVPWWPEAGVALAAECALHVRDTANEVLAARGLARLDAGDNLRELGEAARETTHALGPSAERVVRDMLGFLDDAVAGALDPTVPPAVAARHVSHVACAAADHRPPAARLPPGVTPFLLERERQATWFAARLEEAAT